MTGVCVCVRVFDGAATAGGFLGASFPPARVGATTGDGMERFPALCRLSPGLFCFCCVCVCVVFLCVSTCCCSLLTVVCVFECLVACFGFAEQHGPAALVGAGGGECTWVQTLPSSAPPNGSTSAIVVVWFPVVLAVWFPVRVPFVVGFLGVVQLCSGEQCEEVEYIRVV